MKKLIVSGMTCSHCEKSVKEALGNLKGVKNVNVDLNTKVVTVEGDNLEDTVLKDAVESIGFDVDSIE
ncbi:heavy-metal-associated domain-containing protein [Miniphocaeibacter halophilus]|uniref:Heavy-metal-associated domain-containing protein n=1 Tax=Miniphocaeibacter halophilus TaxID=2931922 RepID=A0AC61MSG6_9FIRM|nr:heavy metal-associated domain-containing protein [Miniphocaeibacter halophilus]QQK07384.1 heavy-metal-associated domain-containing protein [Miniphocaeibacter halophilus]